MTIGRVSTQGLLAQTLTDVQANQTNFQLLQYRVGSGFRFRELKDYGDDVNRVVDLRQSVTQRESYVRSLDIASLTTDSYEVTLDRFAELASELIKASDPTRTQDLTWASDTLTIVDNLMLDLQAGLNTKIADRFIFGGTRSDSEPVRDLRTLARYSVNDIGRANAIETANAIPFYSYNDAAPLPAAAAPANEQSYMNLGSAPGAAAGAGLTDQFLWQQWQSTVDDGQVLRYGITATHSSFQQLIDGLLRLKSATQAGLTVQQRIAFVNEAEVLAENSLTALRQLQSENGVTINQFNTVRERHQSFITITKTSLADLTQVDPAEAATELSALSTQIQASYAAIARREELSLINFLR